MWQKLLELSAFSQKQQELLKSTGRGETGLNIEKCIF